MGTTITSSFSMHADNSEYTPLEYAVNYILYENMISTSSINYHLQIIRDNISIYETTKYDIELLIKLEWMKVSLKPFIVFRDLEDVNIPESIERKRLIEDIIMIFQNRDDNVKNKNEIIGLLKTFTPEEVESLAAYSELVDEREYRVFCDAEKEWIELGRPKD